MKIFLLISSFVLLVINWKVAVRHFKFYKIDNLAIEVSNSAVALAMYRNKEVQDKEYIKSEMYRILKLVDDLENRLNKYTDPDPLTIKLCNMYRDNIKYTREQYSKVLELYKGDEA